MKVGADRTAPSKATCIGCQHYFITYDSRFPYGCKLLGIKSRRQPHIEVLAATGFPCVGYQKKPSKGALD